MSGMSKVSGCVLIPLRAIGKANKPKWQVNKLKQKLPTRQKSETFNIGSQALGYLQANKTEWKPKNVKCKPQQERDNNEQSETFRQDFCPIMALVNKDFIITNHLACSFVVYAIYTEK